jgi:hypothetical protein
MFFKGSRYEKVPEATYVAADGREIRYKTTRFIAGVAAVFGHRVHQSERLDHIAWEHLKDAERFWRICDANRAMAPEEILSQGRVIRIPSAEE